jgi:hypothetical protein
MTTPLRHLTQFARFAIRPSEKGCKFGRVLGGKGLRFQNAVRVELEDAETGAKEIRFLAPGVLVHVLPSLNQTCDLTTERPRRFAVGQIVTEHVLHANVGGARKVS